MNTKTKKILLNIGLLGSLGFGVLNFFIPFIFNWRTYISDVPPSIFSLIFWSNFFSALLLTGLSLLILLFQRKIIEKNIMAIVFYIFLVIVWFAALIMTILLPFNRVYDLAFLIQLSMVLVVFIILLVPMMLILLE
jgi:hypothetical protein